MPDRLQLSRARGWRIPPNSLIVSRPNDLGNPFKVYQHCKGPDGDWGVVDTGRLHAPLGHGWNQRGAHQVAVNAYRKVFDETYPPGSTARVLLAMNLAANDYLACWCGLDLPCHVDVLLEVAAEWSPTSTERTPA
jgi:hypothetical protein